MYENVKSLHFFICLLEFQQISEFRLPSSLERSELGKTNSEMTTSEQSGTRHKFCYQGDMLSVDGDADAAVEARIRIGWNNKFRQLVRLLTNRDISLIRRGGLYSICVRSSMLHGS